MRTRRSFLAAGLVCVLVGGALIAACATFAPTRYQGAVSDHFDGRRFHNLAPHIQRDLGQLFRWLRDRDPGPWEMAANDLWPKPPSRVTEPGALRVTFVNHSTVLLQLAGLNLLTDPIWSPRASPVSFAGPKRYREPGIPFHALPAIDAIVVSHGHYDHMDIPTLKRLSERDRPRILVPLGHAALLRRKGIDQVEELDWWDQVEVAPGVRIIPVPVQHWTARGLFDRNLALWCGFVVDAPGGPIYFAGDTGYAAHFSMARDRFGPMRLALLPIGAYLPRWFMKSMHTSPEDVLMARDDLAAKRAMAIHFGTFQLGDDGQFQATTQLARLRAQANLDDREFWIPDFGEGRDISPLDQ